MFILALLLTILLGYSVIRLFGASLTLAEKVGLSYLCGIAVITLIMFLMDLLTLKFSNINILVILFLSTGLLNFRSIRLGLQKIRNIQFPAISFRFNFVWLLFAVLIFFLAAGSITKSLFWPTIAYDNVAGYDLMGKVMASEGAIDNSLFEINDEPISGSARRCIYPPLVSGSFAFAYLFGLSTSKIMSSLFFIFFIISFYAFLSKQTNSLSAVVFTFFMMITPEFFAFSSLSTTNIPTAIYASLAFIILYKWLTGRDDRVLLISALFMCFTVWSRLDAVFLVPAALIIIYIEGDAKKRWITSAKYFAIAVLPFLMWSIYVRLNFNVDQNVFVNYPFWDGNKLVDIFNWVFTLITNTQLFGIAFYVFGAAILLNIRNISTDNSSKLLMMIILAGFFYTFIYYQMDNQKMDSLNSMMRASYRRGLFIFIPLIWYYVSINKISAQLFSGLNRLLYGQPKQNS